MNWGGEESGAFIGGLAGVVVGEVYGKKTLDAAEPWMPVATPAQGGWRFFKVGVEMR